jgi:hypothetical protein
MKLIYSGFLVSYPVLIMNSVVVCETPKLYNGLGRDVEYTLIEYIVNIPITF